MAMLPPPKNPNLRMGGFHNHLEPPNVSVRAPSLPPSTHRNAPSSLVNLFGKGH